MLLVMLIWTGFVLFIYCLQRFLLKSRQPILTEPHCTKCGYDLRGFTNAAPPVHCPECGTNLTQRGTIRWGIYQPPRRGRIVVVVIVLIAASLIPLLVRQIYYYYMWHQRSAFVNAKPGQWFFYNRSQSTANILAALPKFANQQWGWIELNRRLTAGTLSKADAAKAIDVLIAYQKTLAQPGPLYELESFVQHADGAGDISSTQYQRLAEAFYGKPTIELPLRVRQGGVAAFTVSFSPWKLPGTDLVKAVRKIQADNGQSLSMKSDWINGDRGVRNLDFLSATNAPQIPGKLTADLKPGRHTLRFTVDEAALLSSTAPQLTTADTPGQSNHWPKGRARWTSHVTGTITVVPPNVNPVVLVSDASKNPASTIMVKYVRASILGKSVRITAELSLHNPPIAGVFDVLITVVGKTRNADQLTFGPGETDDVSMQCDVPTLPKDLKKVSILLQPDEKAAEGKLALRESR